MLRFSKSVLRLLRTVVTGLIISAAVRAALVARPPSNRRFVYVIDGPGIWDDGEPIQWLMLAGMDDTGKLPSATDLAVVAKVPNGAPERFVGTAASPGNRYVVAWSRQILADAMDMNFIVRDLVITGNKTFNEHSLSARLNLATVEVAPFNAFLASERAAGVEPAIIADYDFEIMVEGAEGANIRDPEVVHWVNDALLYLRWAFAVGVTSRGEPTGMVFIHVFDLQISGFDGDDIVLVATTAPPVVVPPLSTLLPAGIGPAGPIALGGSTINFAATGEALGGRAAGPRNARMAAGTIAP